MVNSIGVCGKGLHVVVPLNPGCDWDLVKSFARGFAEALEQSQPHRFVSMSTLKQRPRKIFTTCATGVGRPRRINDQACGRSLMIWT